MRFKSWVCRWLWHDWPIPYPWYAWSACKGCGLERRARRKGLSHLYNYRYKELK